MTSADYLILTLGLSSLLLGMWRGMIYELLALMSWLLAFYVATRYPTALMYWMPIDSVLVRKLLSFVLLFLLVLVVVKLLARASTTLVRSLQLGMFDSVLGGLFGLARGVLLVCVVAFILRMTPLVNDARWQYATLRPVVEQTTNFLVNALTILPVTHPTKGGN